MFTSNDLNHPDFFHNPYPYYAKLRTLDKPLWLAHRQETSTDGIWLFSRYEDGLKIFKQTTGISKNIRSIRFPGTGSPLDFHMLHSDADDHLRLRRLVSDFFSLHAIQRMEPIMAEVADALLFALSDRSTFDFMADFAERMPLRVIAKLIGVPENDMEQIRAWSLILGTGFDSLLSSPAVLGKQRQALQEFMAYIDHLTEAKKEATDESLLGFLVRAADSERLSTDELTAMIGFLLFAGHETTISLIGSGLLLLLSHLESWHMLRDDPTLIPNAVEEILRFESPEQRSSFRLVKEPLEINGEIFEPGQQIGVIIGSINRDETVFEHPEVFDIQRTPNKHLAFGIGLHNCLGKTLARHETILALTKVLEHMPELRLLQEEPEWRHNSFFRSLNKLPVTRPSMR